MANRSFQILGKENVGKFTNANIGYFSDSGIWLGFFFKYWQMIFVLPNSPKFSPARILYYMVYNSQLIKTVSYVIKFPAFGFILTAY